MGVTERPRSLNPSKAIAMAICPIIVHFSNWRTRSMHDVACEFARAAVRSKDAQKQSARTSLKCTKHKFLRCVWMISRSTDSFITCNTVLTRPNRGRLQLLAFTLYSITDRKLFPNWTANDSEQPKMTQMIPACSLFSRSRF